MKINLTAGFNGGLEQWFTVIYQAVGSDIKHEDEVNSRPDISIGDVVIHKLKHNKTILPNTEYLIQIRATNDFKYDAVVYGWPSKYKTLGE